MVLFSALLYSLTMKVFVEAGNLFPSGFSGISFLISRSCEKFLNLSIPFGLIYFVLNILVTFFVFKHIGHWFTIYSVIWFTATSILTDILPMMPYATKDPLLIAVFGGCLSGAAIGIALQNDASSGGTDFIAIYMSIKKNKPVWNYVFVGNVGILITAGVLFGWNQALYSIIYQFCCTQVINILHKRYQLSTLFIVTGYPEEVCAAYYKICRHGITRMEATGEFSHKPKSVLFSTLNSYQLHDVVEAIHKVDPHVFINISHTDKIIGNFYQKPLD